jgi:gamma-glutamyltranspeptidase
MGPLNWQKDLLLVGCWGIAWQYVCFAPKQPVLISLQTSGDFMLHDPDWAPIFAPHGYLARHGDHIERLNYSRTLRMIAEKGPDAFYTVR